MMIRRQLLGQQISKLWDKILRISVDHLILKLTHQPSFQLPLLLKGYQVYPKSPIQLQQIQHICILTECSVFIVQIYKSKRMTLNIHN